MDRPYDPTRTLPALPTRPTAQYVEGSGWHVIGDLPIMASDAERRLAAIRDYLAGLDTWRDQGFVTVPIDVLIQELRALIDGTPDPLAF